jgi:diguanylate cyclase (GGDEF)-like protein/PAS domain S-box-containing protein
MQPDPVDLDAGMSDALHESEERFRRAFEYAPIGMALVGLDGRWLQVNRAMCAIVGYSAEELLATTFQALTHPSDLESDLEYVRQLLAGEIESYAMEKRYYHKMGRVVWALLSVSLVRDPAGRPRYFVSQVQDITERKRMEARLEHQALYDSLTGLPNRAVFYDRLAQAVALARRDEKTFAALLLDLDRFKDVNDTFGHHYGDLLLQHVGARLRGVLRESDTIARLGGDEFAALLPGADERGAIRAAGKILVALEEPFSVEGQMLDVGASIGIVLFPEHGDEAIVLLQRADVAMYLAKRGASSYALYAPHEDQYSLRRLTLIGELRQSIAHRQLSLHYQPIVRCATGRIEQVEALARWPHPRYGMIPPAEFIPLAEHTGLIKLLSQAVLRDALHQCRAWYEAGMRTRVAVNLSARNFADDHLPDLIAQAVRTAAASFSWLEVEITESTVMADPERTLGLLRRLHDMGVHISIDDFGTGYSSLAYLQRMPVDTIKIDRSFVHDVVTNEESAMIVRAVTELGHNLGLRVVAEGVEEEETFARVCDLGVDCAQGYYFSPPLAAAEYLERFGKQR